MSFPISFLAPLILLGIILASNFSTVYGQVRDDNLQVESVVSGMEATTGMAFLAPDDLLIIEKNTGQVHRVVKGSFLEQPLLDLTASIYGSDDGEILRILPKTE